MTRWQVEIVILSGNLLPCRRMFPSEGSFKIENMGIKVFRKVEFTVIFSRIVFLMPSASFAYSLLVLSVVHINFHDFRLLQA